MKNNAPKETLDLVGENETIYGQVLLSYVQGKGKKCYIVDKSGTKIENRTDAENVSGALYLTFGDENKVDFFIPVSLNPKIGFSTYDTRKYKDKDGNFYRERHLGNKIIKIITK